MGNTKVKLLDGWTTDGDYKRLYQNTDEIMEVFCHLDLENANVLVDNGCGNGEFSIQASRTYPHLKVFGFDALSSAIQEAQRRACEAKLDSCKFSISWADRLPLADHIADRVIFRSVLHHIEKPDYVFREFYRIMKPGALLFLKTPCNPWEESLSELYSELFMKMDSSHRRFYYTTEKIRKFLTDDNFNILEESVSTYDFPFVNKEMKEFIIENGFEDRLKLSMIEEDKWTIELAWASVLAEKA